MSYKFHDDLDQMHHTKRMDIIREDLIMKSMHPKRLERWIELGGEIDDFYASGNLKRETK